MGFYKKKPFLNLNDIADVINTKGEKYNLNSPSDIQELTDHLIDLAMQGKLTPVFYYDGTICNPDKTDPRFYRNFFIFDTVAISHFIKTGQLIVNMGDVPRNIYIDYHTRKPYRLKTVSDFPIELSFPNHEIFDLFLAYEQSLTQAELQAEIERLTAELNQSNKRIAELESQLTDNEPLGAGVSDTPNNELLAKIFDDTEPCIYAPELHNAIRVWQYIYHDCLTSQHLTNHSDKFDKAVKSLNIEFTSNALKERIKQVTTPQQQKEKTKSKNS